uniref:Sushi domain-containing protein n=1 Tax=Salvator merianae TaxID=96440 RepID=A0A8D0C6Z1_SALMN
MNWLSYITLLLLWRCCTSQKFPVYQQQQVAYQELIDPVIVSGSSTNCGPPPVIDHAMLLASSRVEFLTGSTVFYQCYRLHEMEGTPAARCFNGRWIGVPKCVKTCRADDSDMENNNIQLRWITKSTSLTSSDYWMEFECKPGFRKDPSSPPFRKQCIKGPWVYPRCI